MNNTLHQTTSIFDSIQVKGRWVSLYFVKIVPHIDGILWSLIVLGLKHKESEKFTQNNRIWVLVMKWGWLIIAVYLKPKAKHEVSLRTKSFKVVFSNF